MTDDTPGPDRFDELIEALNNSPDLFPPTHPNGLRSYVTNPDPPTRVAALFAKPPSERGWRGVRSRVADLSAAVRLNQALDRAIANTQRTRAVDITFENETRPL